MIFSLNLVVCDVCTDPGPVGDDVRDARRLAAEEGWRTLNEQSDVLVTEDRCPRHADFGGLPIVARPLP